MTNENNSEQNTSYNQLTTRERIATNDFMKKHPEFTTSKGRTNHFKEQVATEFLRLREEDLTRKKEGKPLLTEDEKQLIVPVPGVIKSVWRAKEEARINRDTEDNRISQIMDAAGLGQNKEFNY